MTHVHEAKFEYFIGSCEIIPELSTRFSEFSTRPLTLNIETTTSPEQLSTVK